MINRLTVNRKYHKKQSQSSFIGLDLLQLENYPVQAMNIFLMNETTYAVESAYRNQHFSCFILFFFLTCFLYIGYFNLKHSRLKGIGRVGKKMCLIVSIL